jgi:FkbM family methyltransferase
MKKYNLKAPSQHKCQIPNLEEIYEKYIGLKPDGTFIEVGAFDGVSWSNTFGLAVAGWNGLMLEPQPDYFALCTKNYEDFPNVKILNMCAGSYSGDIELYTGFSLATTKKEMVEIYNKTEWFKGVLKEENHITAKIDTLDSILQANGIMPGFDLMVVDVEGAELEVLKGCDINTWKPKMVIIEMHEESNLEELKQDNEAINEYFEKAGYSKVFKDETNTIFVLA